MPGRQSTTAPSLKKPTIKRQKAKRSLNALAIAEQQNPTRPKIRQSRLGKSEPEPTKRKRQGEDDEDDEIEDGDGKRKRRKPGDKDRYGNEIEHGSDSSGNEWVVGQVNSDDDSDLDSDEAMGASDEERFEGFGFRGSQNKLSHTKAPSKAAEYTLSNNELRDVDLGEDGDEDLGSAEESDGLGEDAVDLATMLDASDDDRDLNSSPRPSRRSMHKSRSDNVAENGSPAEDEESLLSYSGDEDDARDPAKLASLQALVTTLNEQDQDTGRSRATVDAQESTTPSEFGLNPKRKLTVADMVSSVADPGLRKSLKLLADNDPKPISKKGGIPKKLDVPLPKRQQDRLDRAAAYKQSKETLNRWIDTVKHNRRAEHLSFPLKRPNAAAAPGSQRLLPTSHSLPLTDLESTIQNILEESGLGATNGKSEEEQLQAFEELQANKIPLEEVQARRAELRRTRELLFREETRAKRIKKIKSKSYRKVHRKEREKNLLREKDALKAAGVDDSESQKERQDRRRAEERMGGRHRESKWAKSVKDSGRAKWDEDARGGVTEMARRGEDLRRRMEGKQVAGDGDETVSSESESESEEDDDIEEGDARNNRKMQNRLQRVGEDGNELDPNDKGSRLASMDFMKRAEARRKARNDADVENLRRDLAGEETPSEEEGQEGAGRRSYGPMKMPTSFAKDRQSNRRAEKNEFEEPPGSDDEDGDGRSGVGDEDVDIVVDKSSSQVKKANGAGKPSLGDKHRRKLNESQKEGTSENTWLMEQSKDFNPSKRRVQNPNASAIISNAPAITTAPPPAEKPKPRSALKGARQAEALRQSVQAPTEQPPPAPPPTDHSHSGSESSDEDDTAALPFVLRNQDLVRKAFAGDSVVADFEREKRATAQDQGDKVVDSTMPGWGSWTGPGIGKKAQRRNNKGRVLSTVPGVAAEKRRDAKLERVIISEKRVRKNGRYLAGSLPHPFETREQYERSLRLPVGPEWTTKETFQGMTKPRILMKPGVIAPMSKPMI